MFQVSGQGPYFGQCTWLVDVFLRNVNESARRHTDVGNHNRFTYLHPEKLPSAIERYSNEIKRVLGVLDGALAANPSKWLVGDRITYADLAFIPWNDRLDATLGVPDDKKFEGFPHVKAWHEVMTARPSWVKAMDTRARLMDEQGLDWNGMPKGTSNYQEYQDSLNKGKA